MPTDVIDAAVHREYQRDHEIVELIEELLKTKNVVVMYRVDADGGPSNSRICVWPSLLDDSSGRLEGPTLRAALQAAVEAKRDAEKW